jgi:Carboxypeptidase regulatory-like domain
MMKRAILMGLFVLAALLASQNVLAGQHGKKGPSTLAGVVLGPDDKPVGNASVTYQSSGGNAPHAVRADARGHFAINGLRADNYDIRATYKGVFSEWEKNVTLHHAETKNITLRLIYAKEMPKPGAPGTAKH